MLPLWLKPSYVAIAVLLALLGVQSYRLAGAHAATSAAVLKQQTLVADIATARAAGLEEGARRQKLAYDALTAAHLQIVAGLESDKAELEKHYNQTYGILKDLAAQPQWACLKEPLPEPVLQEFRR